MESLIWIRLAGRGADDNGPESHGQMSLRVSSARVAQTCCSFAGLYVEAVLLGNSSPRRRHRCSYCARATRIIRVTGVRLAAMGTAVRDHLTQRRIGSNAAECQDVCWDTVRKGNGHCKGLGDGQSHKEIFSRQEGTAVGRRYEMPFVASLMAQVPPETTLAARAVAHVSLLPNWRKP